MSIRGIKRSATTQSDARGAKVARIEDSSGFSVRKAAKSRNEIHLHYLNGGEDTTTLEANALGDLTSLVARPIP